MHGGSLRNVDIRVPRPSVFPPLKTVSGHQCACRMQCFCKTLEMGEIGVWPRGVDFRQVHWSALRLLKGQDRTGQRGGRAEAIPAVIRTNSRPSSTRLEHPTTTTTTPNRPNTLPTISFIDWNATGQWNCPGPFWLVPPGPAQALTGGQKCTLHLSAPPAAPWRQIPVVNKRERKNDTT